MRESGGKFISLFKFSILYFKNVERVKCPTWMCGCTNEVLVAQSEEVHETTAFIDEVSGEKLGWKVDSDALDLGDATEASSLEDFLSRPLRINTFDWLQTTPQGLFNTISPWSLYLNDTRVAKKLANFAFLRANMHLKFVVNGSPFYYGSMRCVYQPLPNFTPSTIKSTGAQSLIPYSQRPGLYLRPGKNEGGELVLPFVWPKTWITNGVDSYDDLGTLTYHVYALLRSANSVTGSSVTVVTYAWLTDVHLSSATVIPQSTEKDEYGDGPVSRPASAVAKVASSFKSVPMIGKFASATEIGANAVASIAKLFGYTNVPVIDDVSPYAPSAFPNFATTETGFPVHKLTTDAKNELSVTPEALGLPSEDELSLSSLNGRESYITQFIWNTTDGADTLLFNSRVTPRMFYLASETTNALVDQTPMCFASAPFQYWRGDIIFRFQVVRSEYHRGRLRISFDPSGNATNNLLNTAENSNVVYTEIIDIAETDNVEFRVPYQQALAYLELRQTQFYQTTHIPWQDASFQSAQVGKYCNGYITVRVLNELSAPVASAPVSVMVFVKGADNLEYANPRDIPPYTSVFQAQSLEQDEGRIAVNMTKSKTSEQPERSRVYMGERILSMRPLLRRMQYVGPFNITTVPDTTSVGTMEYYFHKIPPYWGFDLNGENLAVKLVGSGNTAMNYANTTLLNWLLPAFLLYRGSVNWSFNLDGAGVLSANCGVSRYLQGPQQNAMTGHSVGQSANGLSYVVTKFIPTGTGGMTVTNQTTQSGLNISLPNYTNYKFQSTVPTAATKPATTGAQYDGSSTDVGVFWTTNRKTLPAYCVLNRFAAIGTDFNMHYFINVPTLYYYATVPTSP